MGTQKRSQTNRDPIIRKDACVEVSTSTLKTQTVTANQHGLRSQRRLCRHRCRRYRGQLTSLSRQVRWRLSASVQRGVECTPVSLRAPAAISATGCHYDVVNVHRRRTFYDA